MMHYVAIDPLALLLPGPVYVRIKLPNPPPVEAVRSEVRHAVRMLEPDEVPLALANARTMIEYGQIMEQEVRRASVEAKAA